MILLVRNVIFDLLLEKSFITRRSQQCGAGIVGYEKVFSILHTPRFCSFRMVARPRPGWLV